MLLAVGQQRLPLQLQQQQVVVAVVAKAAKAAARGVRSLLGSCQQMLTR